MRYEVRVRRAAERDIDDAQQWYESAQRGLGLHFHDEVMRVLGRLGDSPMLYPCVHDEVRRAVLRRFPFLVWYRVSGQVVRVLAVTHGAGDPAEALSRAS